jgi:hypothetical protein
MADSAVAYKPTLPFSFVKSGTVKFLLKQGWPLNGAPRFQK